jgi:hypothetical protein
MHPQLYCTAISANERVFGVVRTEHGSGILIRERPADLSKGKVICPDFGLRMACSLDGNMLAVSRYQQLLKQPIVPMT